MGCLPRPIPHICRKPSGFFFLGGGESGTCDSCCHLHRRCVSQRRVLSVLWVFFEVTQRRRDSVDGLICCLSVLHPGSLGCLCSCRRVIASVFLRSSVDSGAHPLALSPSLCGAAAEGSWTIEAGGCAWQSYWGAQPECRWHSPLRSLPRSPACWVKRGFTYKTEAVCNYLSFRCLNIIIGYDAVTSSIHFAQCAASTVLTKHWQTFQMLWV